MFLKKNLPGSFHSSIQPPLFIPVHLIPQDRMTPVTELKELALKQRALVRRKVLTTDDQSTVIPEDEELPNFVKADALKAYHERHRTRARLPRRNGHELSNISTSSVQSSRRVLQAFNPDNLFEELTESTAIKKKREANIPGAKSNAMIKEWVYEDLPTIICEEDISNGSLSNTDDIQWELGSEGDDEMSKENSKGMTPKDPRTSTPKKTAESFPSLSDPNEEFVDHFKELCELMSDSQMVHIPRKQKPRVPAATSPPVVKPKKEEEKVHSRVSNKKVTMKTLPKKTTLNKKTSQGGNEQKEAVKITAKVGTLKRKQSMQEFLDQIPKDDHDDLLSDNLFQYKKRKLSAVPMKCSCTPSHLQLPCVLSPPPPSVNTSLQERCRLSIRPKIPPPIKIQLTSRKRNW